MRTTNLVIQSASRKSWNIRCVNKGSVGEAVTWKDGRLRYWKTEAGAQKWADKAFSYWVDIHEAQNHAKWFCAFAVYLQSTECPNLGMLRDRSLRSWDIRFKDESRAVVELRQFKAPIYLKGTIEINLRDRSEEAVALCLSEAALKLSRNLSVKVANLGKRTFTASEFFTWEVDLGKVDPLPTPKIILGNFITKEHHA